MDPGVFWVSLGIHMLFFVVWGVCMTGAPAPQQSSGLEREAGG